MLYPAKSFRRLAIGGSLLIAPGLAVVGLLGGGIEDERFEAKQIVVEPNGADGVRIIEVVDDDFGTVQRHGYERLVPNDFGVPEDVVAFSPDAADSVSVANEGSITRIRIGDPDITYTGQHRYVLAYTLPNAQISTGQLALDIADNETSLETGRMEIVVVGFDLQDPLCNVGDFGDSGGCELVREGDVYRAVIEPLAPHVGVTIGGTITATYPPTDVAAPAIPKRREDKSTQWAIGLGGVGLLAAAGGFFAARRLGRNEVGGGGATDAAFAGTSKVVAATASLPTRLVSDAQLDDMATTEFEAPRGLRPWQGTLLLTEKVSTDSVSAWFSDLIAQEALVLRGDSTQVLAAGPKLASLPPAEQEQVAKLFAGDTDGEIVMGRYNARLGKLWQKVLADQVEAAESSGWWTKFPPGSRPKFPKSLGLAVIGAGSVMAISFWQHWLRAWPAAIATAFAIPAAVTGHFYRPLLPVRSAEGSALALRAESFRRFLAASEGPHVDWAWKHGLLREYSAWAVALGAADAWGRAIANSTVPPQEAALHSAPMYPYARSSEWDQSHTRYTSSGSSGGGSSSGFSGGSVGGGGGGGSSGNW